MSEYIYERPDEPAKVVRDGWNVRIEWDFKQREEIVRCRDCRYYEDTGNCNWFECSTCWLLAEVTHDGFCAWGERRG